MKWLLALYMATPLTGASPPGDIHNVQFATKQECEATAASVIAATKWEQYDCIDTESTYWVERLKLHKAIMIALDSRLDDYQRWTYQLCRAANPNCPYIGSSIYNDHYMLPSDLPNGEER